MRFIKLGIISVVFLFLIVTAISALIPSTVVISRTIDVNVPFDSVYSNVHNLNNWQRWLYNRDTVRYTVASAGGKSSLRLDYLTTHNSTTITILQASPESIKTLWQVGTARGLEGDFYFISKAGEPVVSLQWQFIQKVKWYPWEKFSLIFSDKAFGPFMEKSLDNLKMLLEQKK